MGSGPSPGAPTPLQQAAHAPDLTAGITQTQDALKRRMGLAATVLTGPGGASVAPLTTGKALLGN